MPANAKDLLRRLGAGESIEAVCADAGMTAASFQEWWQNESASRVPGTSGSQHAPVHQTVKIDRDRCGIPHIHAENDEDLFFGFGYAMAQDRLFQLDFLRRKGAGRLCEILDVDGNLDVIYRIPGIQNTLEWDILARTIGLRRIAEAEWQRLPVETRRHLESFSAGINALMDETRDRLPVEFDLLDYRPEPWSPIDSLTIEVELRWYLTVRFPVIVLPELAKRALGDGPLYEAFLWREDDDESIIQPGAYEKTRRGFEPVGEPLNGPGSTGGGSHGSSTTGKPISPCTSDDVDNPPGSNNWVIAGKLSASGKPMVASDPHIAFDAVSCWYEVHLCGGSFNVLGMAYVGMPGVMFGRNAQVAWGCTNNICSQRDLYQEKTDPDHPGCFLYDGQWEPAGELEETIPIKGQEPRTETIRFSRNGPIVTDVLPPEARDTGPVSLKWLGSYQGGWLTALHGMNRAESAAEFREAMRPWHVATFGVVYADVEGHIGYQATGRIPIREVKERGYRPGWDPEHQWQGLVPFECMPHWIDPPRGWLYTANNRTAPEDFPYPLSGVWNEGLRAARVRQMLEAKDKFTRDDFIAMQQDALSLRARRCMPTLLQVLSTSSQARVQDAAGYWRDWDFRIESGSVAATLFELFFVYWTRRVAEERFEGEIASSLTAGLTSLAAALLEKDSFGWFSSDREAAIHNALEEAIEWLKENVSRDMADWTWGGLHTIPLQHVLSGRGDLDQLLDHGNLPVKGSLTTVCNTGMNANYKAKGGAGYRLIADLNEDPPGLWAIDGQSQSGHPGSPHYSDQLDDWLNGGYHFLALDANKAKVGTTSRLLLEPVK